MDKEKIKKFKEEETNRRIFRALEEEDFLDKLIDNIRSMVGVSKGKERKRWEKMLKDYEKMK